MARRKPYTPPLGQNIVLVEVDNPYAVGPIKITAAVSTRDDPLRGMLARGQIDQAQFEAGRLWQKYREDSEVGGLKAMDWRREPVDGTPVYPEPITDRQRKAVDALNAIVDRTGRDRSRLNPWEARLVQSILDRRLTINQAAAERGFISTRGVLFIGKRFRGCLESLAVLWGLVGEPR